MLQVSGAELWVGPAGRELRETFEALAVALGLHPPRAHVERAQLVVLGPVRRLEAEHAVALASKECVFQQHTHRGISAALVCSEQSQRPHCVAVLNQHQ